MCTQSHASPEIDRCRMAEVESVMDTPARHSETALAPTGADRRTCRLEALVYQRIQDRLGRRVRNLAVEVDRGVIRLAGQCSTFYSKQLALHAVLGVVEDEVVDNRIEVAVPRAASRD